MFLSRNRLLEGVGDPGLSCERGEVWDSGLCHRTELQAGVRPSTAQVTPSKPSYQKAGWDVFFTPARRPVFKSFQVDLLIVAALWRKRVITLLPRNTMSSHFVFQRTMMTLLHLDPLPAPFQPFWSEVAPLLVTRRNQHPPGARSISAGAPQFPSPLLGLQSGATVPEGSWRTT